MVRRGTQLLVKSCIKRKIYYLLHGMWYDFHADLKKLTSLFDILEGKDELIP